MAKLSNKMLAFVLSFAMIVTNFMWLGAIETYAAEGDTVLKIQLVTGAEQTPVEGVTMLLKSNDETGTDTQFDNPSDADGLSQYELLGDELWVDEENPEGYYTIELPEESNYTADPVKVEFKATAGGELYVATVGGAEYSADKPYAISLTAKAEPVKEWNENCFTYSEDNATVTGLTDEGKAMIEVDPVMVLPATHNNVAITSIGERAFASTKITQVIFPNTIKTIDVAAFNLCTEITSLNLPASLESLGQQAFNGTNKVESITFEEGIKITSIPDAAFQKTASTVQVKQLSIPEGVTSVGKNSFGGLMSEEIAIPTTLTNIGERAFMNNKLSSFIIPKNVEVIGNMAFSQQNAKVKGTLKELSFEDGSKTSSIGKQAFDYASLRTVDVPASVIKLDADTFKNNIGGKVTLNLTNEDQFNGTGEYEEFVADGSGHRSTFNGVVNYQITFDTAGRSSKNDAYTKKGVLSENDLTAARSNQPYDVFDGWYTDASEGEKVDTTTVFSSDTVLYAHWSENNALKEAEEAVANATTAAGDAKAAAEKAAETKADEDIKAAAEKLADAKDKIATANEKIQAAEEFAENNALSGTGVTRTKTASRNFANANVTVTQLDADATAEAAKDAAAKAADAKAKADEAAKTAGDEAVAAAKDAETAAKEAAAKADEAANAANAAAEAAKAAYGEDSDQYKDAAAKATEAQAAKADADKAASDATDAVKAAEKAKADKDAADAKAAAEAKAKTVTTVTVNTKTVNAAAIDAAVKAAGGSNQYVTKIVLGSKVKKIGASAFKNYKKVTTLEVKTKKLSKKSVKKSLKGSAVKTIKVKISKKAATNKKFVKKYKKFFTKKNAGKKASVKK